MPNRSPVLEAAPPSTAIELRSLRHQINAVRVGEAGRSCGTGSRCSRRFRQFLTYRLRAHQRPLLPARMRKSPVSHSEEWRRPHGRPQGLVQHPLQVCGAPPRSSLNSEVRGRLQERLDFCPRLLLVLMGVGVAHRDARLRCKAIEKRRLWIAELPVRARGPRRRRRSPFRGRLVRPRCRGCPLPASPAKLGDACVPRIDVVPVHVHRTPQFNDTGRDAGAGGRGKLPQFGRAAPDKRDRRQARSATGYSIEMTSAATRRFADSCVCPQHRD